VKTNVVSAREKAAAIDLENLLVKIQMNKHSLKNFFSHKHLVDALSKVTLQFNPVSKVIIPTPKVACIFF